MMLNFSPDWPSEGDCPCGSGMTYGDCCQPCHRDPMVAKSAERLMRSRYSAFVLKLEPYLLKTWYPTTRPASLALQHDATRWLKLEVLNCRQGGARDSKGKVAFKAYYQDGLQVGCLHEISRFRKLGGQWFYLDGEIIASGAEPVE